jgi:glycosyltransferase involved in cell wall biosynthesis
MAAALGYNRILYIQYTNPGGYPPLQHSSRMLAEAGWQVLFLGTGAAGANSLEFPAHRNISVRRMDFCTPGWRQKVHFARFCAWVLWTTLLWRPKWVYASDPLSCPAALLLTFLPGLGVLYHEHDAPPADTSGGSFACFVSAARRRVAQRVAICVLPNAERLRRFQCETGPLRAAVCVWNCPGLYEMSARSEDVPQTPIWLLYHGSVVPDRLPLTVINALASCADSVHLRVVGYETIGSQGYIETLKRHAQSLGIAHRLECLPALPRADLLSVSRTSHIGLALIPNVSSDGNFTAMTGASNKVFDYMACGLPVIVSDLADWRRMFVDPGYARACNPADPESITAAIRSLVEHPDRMRAMGEAGRRRIVSEWNYEAVFRPVLDCLNGQSAAIAAVREPVETVAMKRSA